MLLYTYISRFSVAPIISNRSISDHLSLRFSTSLTNGPRLLSRVKVGTHSPSPKKSHTAAHRAKQGAFRMGALSLPSERSARSRTSPGRVSERQTLPLLGLGRGRSQRTQKAFGTAMRLCASLSRGVAAPLGCVTFFFCRSCGLFILRSRLSACARRGALSLPSVCFACSRNAGRPLAKADILPFSEVGGHH